jgi:hypothetical protein
LGDQLLNEWIKRHNQGLSPVVLPGWFQFIQIFSVLPAKFAAPVHVPGLLAVPAGTKGFPKQCPNGMIIAQFWNRLK